MLGSVATFIVVVAPHFGDQITHIQGTVAKFRIPQPDRQLFSLHCRDAVNIAETITN